MRGRAVSSILIGLGAFALVAALCVRLILVPNVVKLPLKQEADPVAVGTGLSFVDPETFELREGESGSVEQHVIGDPASDDANDDVAVWNFGSFVFDADHRQLDVSSYRVCLDRRTAESIPDCSVAHVNNKKDVDIEGLTLTFPFGTEKKDYQLFNASAGASFPAKFAGEDEIDGLSVYRFEQTVPETVLRQAEVPGEFAGVPGNFSVTADYVYTNQRTLWVEPTSGVIVTAEEHPSVVLRGPDGTTGVTGLAGTFAADDGTRADGVARAEDVRDRITLVGTYVPLGLLGLGLLALVAGGLLWRRAAAAGESRPRHEAPDERPVEAAEVH
jgi:hypothetical protein